VGEWRSNGVDGPAQAAADALGHARVASMPQPPHKTPQPRSRSADDALGVTNRSAVARTPSRSLRRGGASFSMVDRVRRQLTQCESDKLLKVAARCSGQVDVAGAVTALHRLARDTSFRENGRDRRLEGLLKILRRPLLRGEGLTDRRQLANITWSFARLSVADDPLIDALSAEAIVGACELSCQELASTFWAFARLESLHSRLMDVISARAVAMISEFGSSQLANMSWSVARAQATDSEPLVGAIASRTFATLSEFPPQDMASIAWACAKLCVEDRPLIEAISSEVLTKVSAVNHIDTSNLVWAFGEFGVPTEQLTAAVSAEVMARIPQGLAPRELGGWLWCFAKLGIESGEFLGAISADVVSKLGDFSSQELAGLLWSISRQAAGPPGGVTCVDEALVDAIIIESTRRIGEFSGQHLAMVASAFSRMSRADASLSESICATARVGLRDFTASDLAGMTWSIAQMSVEDAPLMDAISAEVVARLGTFSLHELSSLASAYATMVHQDRALMQSIATELISGVNEMTAQDLSKTQWACSKLMYLDEELVDALSEASITRIQEFQPVHLANVVWSCAKLLTKTEALVDSLCGASMGRITEFSAQNLANTVWAIATLNYTITEKMEAFIEESVKKICEFGPQGLSNTSWAFAKMDQKFDDLMDAIAEEAKAKVGEFETQNLSNTVWAYATLRIENEELMMTLSDKVVVKIHDCTCRDLASSSWAFARIHMPNPKLVGAMSGVVLGRIPEFEAKGLSNTAWAFATLGMRDEDLMNALASEVMKKVRKAWADGSMKIEDLATDINGLTWAMDHAGVLTRNLSSTILALMRDLGRAKDFEMSTPDRPPPAQIETVSPEDHPGDAPILRDDELPDMCVVHKPAGWEVDNQDAGGGPWMSSWLMEQFNIDQVPICHYEEHQFGMVQRLDIPSSGLILVGKTWEGFYTLKWQLQTGNITRDSVLLVHNWVELDSKVNDQSFAEKAAEGAAAPAQLTVIAHLRREDEEDARMSLVLMRARKASRSDLRTHFAGAGHPTVADGKYSDRETYLRDREWCARKFMHCYRLEYRDSKDVIHKCVEPLPHDLRDSLAKLLPRGRESAAAVEDWVEGKVPRPWDEYEGLHGLDGD